MSRLKGKVAVIVGVGAAIGIGASTARLMAAEGASLVLADLNVIGAQGIADEINGNGGEAIALGVDLADDVSVKHLFEELHTRVGRLDIAHINAADTRTRQDDTDAFETPIEIFDQTLIVGLRGYFLCTKYALPLMLMNGSGSIIYTSSDSAFVGTPNHVAYQTAKAGVNGLMRHVATRWGKQNIRANSISPGLVLTETVKRDHSDQSQAAFLAMTKSPRLGEPEDIAALVTFLASNDAGWINGQVYSINGGLLMR